MGVTDGPNENVVKVLKPDKLFPKNEGIQPGDAIEVCPASA